MTTSHDPEIRAGFLAEAAGYLPALRAGVAAFRADPADPGLLDEAHRHAHTIGGAAPMVGLPGLGAVARALEATLDEPLAGRLAPDAAAFDGLDAMLAAAEACLREADEAVRDDGLPPPEFLGLPDAPDFAELAPAPADDAPTAELLEVFRLEADDHLRVLTTVLSRALTEAVSNEEWREVPRAAPTS